jgi:ADP-ribose pyrophosphatase
MGFLISTDMPESKEKFWKIEHSKKGFEGNWIHVNLDDILLPDGSKIIFEAIEFQRHGTGVVAVNENGEVMLVQNFRYINDYYSWEIPAGTIPPGMDHADCIIEELEEEAGCTVDRKDLKYIGNYFPSIGSSNQIFHCYIARNVRRITETIDANEIIEARWFSRQEIIDMILKGVIKDGFSLYLLLRYLYLQD